MTKVSCKIWKCKHNKDGICVRDKVNISKLGCIDVKIY